MQTSLEIIKFFIKFLSAETYENNVIMIKCDLH